MGKAADATGIHFRMLNTTKGPAVQSPRCQSDKEAYSLYFRKLVTETPHLYILHDLVMEIVAENGVVKGVKTQSGSVFTAKAVVLTTGTFLGGVLHIGNQTFVGGRTGEPAAPELSKSLAAHGIVLGRLKTGTPVRLLKTSLHYDRMTRQDPDPVPQPFSFETTAIDRPTVPCWMTKTTEETHRIIKENLHRAPLYTGQITSPGPRYCPSIETKVVRFADKPSHTVFVEPEGIESEEMYPNGISTSMPVDVQEKMVHSIPGLEDAVITRWAYAVEYDFVRTHQLAPTMSCKPMKGLFIAGQINGTSGYEEAAAQGLIAGVNAARMVLGKELMTVPRDSSYIGVLIDDLVTHDMTEPYRMFTSRAENRLSLRHDNADRRLLELAEELGLLSKERIAQTREKERKITEAVAVSRKEHVDGKSVDVLLKRQDANVHALFENSPALAQIGLTKVEREQLALDLRYEGYLKRQESDKKRSAHMEEFHLAEDLDYRKIPGLRNETREKLTLHKPDTLGRARRIPGITPADITVIELYLRKLAPK
jgi:tRNA uridine 5-carboxymethylaminomethyl modification enzyme